ncbi:hypothetical protein DCAR_0415547 [Daucus carota subsp. sativus]|uniref:Malectin-like domain-containing protein n=1 Tax=Daucus carota subsp. sativus TaxID=79200 RepID=A0AAF0WUU5_DAUCS|nr:hypothetical protein DCAR_0415547 [Daucus carota subsp. sativus]
MNETKFNFAHHTFELCTDSPSDISGWRSIDCGTNRTQYEGMLQWEMDSSYTETGLNILVQNKTTREELNTLRFFPNNIQDNCYSVPAETLIARYIIRAGFYYGNYDGLSRPPAFSLFINDVIWTTINTAKNNGEPFYKEIMYESNGSGVFKICLVQIKDGGYNRIWSKGVTPYNCDNITGLTDFTAAHENYPPDPVLKDSVQPRGTDTIILTVDVPESAPQIAYFVFYITELFEKDTDERRTMILEIDGQDHGTVEAPSKGETTVVTKYPVIVSGPTINITLTRDKNSTLPPMIAAMEVFTKWATHVKQNYKAPSSGAAGGFISFAFSLMIPFVLLLVA